MYSGWLLPPTKQRLQSTTDACFLSVVQADREALSAQLSSMEDWLYDEGEDEKKSTYVSKLTELKAKGDPIEARAAEDQTRPGRCLNTSITSLLILASVNEVCCWRTGDFWFRALNWHLHLITL